MSPTSSMWDSMNIPTIFGRKSSHEADVERHVISCYTESRALVDGTELIESIGA